MKNNKKGFTLAELLIVVAIIAVLVAISIPIFTAQLEKAREATDMANLRAAKAAFVAEYLTNGENMESGTYNYDAPNGKLAKGGTATNMSGTATDPGTYTADNNEYKYVSGTDYTGTGISITYTAASGTSKASAVWSTGGTLVLE